MTEEQRHRRKNMILTTGGRTGLRSMKLKENAAILLDVPKGQRRETEKCWMLLSEGRSAFQKEEESTCKPDIRLITGTFSDYRGLWLCDRRKEDGEQDPVFTDKTADAMNGDTVQITIETGGEGSRRGRRA